jgi:hypothetical protein
MEQKHNRSNVILVGRIKKALVQITKSCAKQTGLAQNKSNTKALKHKKARRINGRPN